MKDNENLKAGDKVCIESIYGSPYHGVVVGNDRDDHIMVIRDDQEYSKSYNPKRITKDGEE